MLIALKVFARGIALRDRLGELTYLSNHRQTRATIGRARMKQIRRHAVRAGWTTRTTAGVLAAVWIGQLARQLEPTRRLRLGQQILTQQRDRLDALEWIIEYQTGRKNMVGTDVFLMRFNVANGTIAAWLEEGLAVDPAARNAVVAMAAWGLAGIPEDEADERLAELLEQLDP